MQKYSTFHASNLHLRLLIYLLRYTAVLQIPPPPIPQQRAAPTLDVSTSVEPVGLWVVYGNEGKIQAWQNINPTLSMPDISTILL